ncbi:MAG: tetratricopeptide repeat protein [Planctomycetota bacterium]|jgi:outer membrane protein assembly factor BamD (BamD/ComL family)
MATTGRKGIKGVRNLLPERPEGGFAQELPDTFSPEGGSAENLPDTFSPAVVDVWSRSGSKYRIRAVVLLAVNVLLFAGLGSFAFWLRSGERFAPALNGYWDELAQTFRFGQQTSVSLAAFLIEPINVQDVPMQIPIVGLLMAALISVPILVSILYRFWSSLPFIAVVGFLAVMPWLALTLLGSCIIASVRPFRARFRFVAALLGLLPTVLYLILAWQGSNEILAGRIDPVDRIKFIAPWVLAIVAATLVFVIVLTIAKIVDYRPGAITPLLAVMFGLPVALFEFHVGRDELYYRLLEKLNHAHFADIDGSLALDEAVDAAWHRHPIPRPPRSALRQVEEVKWQFELAADLGPHQSDLTRHQTDLAQRCDWFHRHFPDSPYTPNALYIKARAYDMRVDHAEFRRTKWIRFYDDFPSKASQQTWRVLAEHQPDSVLACVARLRLAQYDARVGDVERSIDKLEELIKTAEARKLQADEAPESDGGVLKGVLARERPEAGLDVPFDRVVLEAHRLHDLLVSNRDPIYGFDPISGRDRRTGAIGFGLMDLEPRSERYVENLRMLEQAYPHCQIEDNICVEAAKASPALPLKISRLETCIDRFSSTDAMPEALFRLAVAYRVADSADKSERTFAELATEYPDSVWSEQALQHSPHSSAARLTRADR